MLNIELFKWTFMDCLMYFDICEFRFPSLLAAIYWFSFNYIITFLSDLSQTSSSIGGIYSCRCKSGVLHVSDFLSDRVITTFYWLKTFMTLPDCQSAQLSISILLWDASLRQEVGDTHSTQVSSQYSHTWGPDNATSDYASYVLTQVDAGRCVFATSLCWWKIMWF